MKTGRKYALSSAYCAFFYFRKCKNSKKKYFQSLWRRYCNCSKMSKIICKVLSINNSPSNNSFDQKLIFFEIKNISRLLFLVCIPSSIYLSDFDCILRCSVGAVCRRIVWSSILLGESRQVLAATPHKTPTVRPPASYHENYSS